MAMAQLDPSVARPIAPGAQSAAALGEDLAPAELAAWRGLLRVHAALALLGIEPPEEMTGRSLLA
jgi:hypothetical protein